MTIAFIDPDATFFYAAIFNDDGVLTDFVIIPFSDERLIRPALREKGVTNLVIEKLDSREGVDQAVKKRIEARITEIMSLGFFNTTIFPGTYKGGVPKQIFQKRLFLNASFTDPELKVIKRIPQRHYMDIMDCVGNGLFYHDRIGKGGAKCH